MAENDARRPDAKAGRLPEDKAVHKPADKALHGPPQDKGLPGRVQRDPIVQRPHRHGKRGNR
jgi:hypothetical protein